MVIEPRAEEMLALVRSEIERAGCDGMLTAVILSFAHTLGEFGVVLMVGGNLPGSTRTVSIAIYDDVQSLNLSAAHQTALLLLTFSFVTLSVVYALSRKPWAVAPWR